MGFEDYSQRWWNEHQFMILPWLWITNWDRNNFFKRWEPTKSSSWLPCCPGSPKFVSGSDPLPWMNKVTLYGVFFNGFSWVNTAGGSSWQWQLGNSTLNCMILCDLTKLTGISWSRQLHHCVILLNRSGNPALKSKFREARPGKLTFHRENQKSEWVNQRTKFSMAVC